MHLKEENGQKKVFQKKPNFHLKRERELRGWSQALVAEKIGAQPKLINRWESGSVFPSPYYREKLCTLFEKDAGALGLLKLHTDLLSSPSPLSEELQSSETPISPPQLPLKPQPHSFSRRSIMSSILGGGISLGLAIGATSWWIASHSGTFTTQKIGDPITRQYSYQTNPKSTINSVNWSYGGTSLVCCNGNKTAQILNARHGELGVTYHGHTNYVNYASWAPHDNAIASASSDTTVQIWRSSTGELSLSYTDHKTPVICAVWSPDGTMIASSDKEGSIHVWNSTTGHPILVYHGHNAEVTDLNWSPDNQWIASCGYDRTIQVWNAMTGKASPSFIYHGSRIGTVYEVRWSPNGQFLASGEETTVAHIWHAHTGELVKTYTGHIREVYTIRWSPDGQWVASGGPDTTVQIWSAFTKKRTLIYRGHTQSVNEIAWSPDGKRVASASDDLSLHVCQVRLQ